MIIEQGITKSHLYPIFVKCLAYQNISEFASNVREEGRSEMTKAGKEIFMGQKVSVVATTTLTAVMSNLTLVERMTDPVAPEDLGLANILANIQMTLATLGDRVARIEQPAPAPLLHHAERLTQQLMGERTNNRMMTICQN
ncbi:unnamed protein product [Thlaspi arvense]|uniref:Uncharacterized protein n=1 Tax=Thlaspi arvense TaxID=13288 RepID=A0AAU9SE36_THLAR|nr:unnamed protein product [Thlaspi arvense]